MVSLYDAAIPPVVRGIQNTVANLQKVAKEAKNDEELQQYLSCRLHPTMHDLAKQINHITNISKSIPKRLNESLPELTLPDDCETTFQGLIDRLNKTIEYLESIKREDIEGREDAEVVLEFTVAGTKRKIQLTAVDYVFNMGYANFWFHCTTAYGILRKEGADLGKMDFLNGAGQIKVTSGSS